MPEVSHFIIRCVNCSTLEKVHAGDVYKTVIDDYLLALRNEESEIIMLCNGCRKKTRHNGR